jgi:hypothetical protein
MRQKLVKIFYSPFSSPPCNHLQFFNSFSFKKVRQAPENYLGNRMSVMEAPKKKKPSERWASFDDWDYDGMKERLEKFMASINKTALAEHAEIVLNSPVSMSEPFIRGGSK